jgi:hypothetical protein
MLIVVALCLLLTPSISAQTVLSTSSLASCVNDGTVSAFSWFAAIHSTPRHATHSSGYCLVDLDGYAYLLGEARCQSSDRCRLKPGD